MKKEPLQDGETVTICPFYYDRNKCMVMRKLVEIKFGIDNPEEDQKMFRMLKKNSIDFREKYLKNKILD